MEPLSSRKTTLVCFVLFRERLAFISYYPLPLPWDVDCRLLFNYRKRHRIGGGGGNYTQGRVVRKSGRILFCCYRLFSSPEWQCLHGEQFSAAFCQRALALWWKPSCLFLLFLVFVVAPAPFFRCICVTLYSCFEGWASELTFLLAAVEQH